MKLLFLNSIGKKKWGGGEKWMVLAASKLIKKGHVVYVGCRKGSVLEQRAKEKNIPVVNISIYTDFSLIGHIALKHCIQSKNIDLIIGCQNKDVRVAGFTSKLLKGPTVLSRQGVQLLNNSLKYKWSFLPFCDGIITNTQSIKKEYDSYGWWDSNFVKVIYNGINLDAFSKKKFDLSAYLPKSQKKPFIIVSTGRLAKQKGFEYLISAAKWVIDKKPDTYFFIAGEGKLKSELQKQIKDFGIEKNFHLLGFHSNVSELLNAADLFVLPSLYEGMPNSLMEALAHGIPSISTRVNGVEELMIDGEHGYIVKSGDANALEEAIIKCIDDSDIKHKGTKGAQHVISTFSIEKMVQKLEKHLLQKIKKH